MKKRITAFVLCILMTVGMVLPYVYASGNYSDDVGKYVQLNPYYADSYIFVHDGTNKFAITEAMTLGYEEFEEGLIFRITDWYLDNVNSALWYQVEPYQGNLPEGMPDGAWIMQNYTDGSSQDEDTLLFVEVEPEEERNDVMLNGEPVSEVAMPKYEKPVLEASVAQTDSVTYRWQVLADAEAGLWVDITGETYKELNLSYGKVAAVLDEKNQVQVRCIAVDAGVEQISDPVTITLMPRQLDDITQTAPESVSMDREAITVNSESGDEDEGDTRIYKVTVNFVFEDGVTLAAEAQIITVPASGVMENDIIYPAVEGYLPYIKNENGEFIRQDQFTATTITEDTVLTVYYLPDLVRYRVEVYLQNLYDDNYTKLDTVIERQAVTGTLVPDFTQEQPDGVKLEYEGFYPLLHEMPEVAADGSTVVEVRFDRYYYLMTFELGGGYGVEPIYARFGMPVTVTDPIRPGYVFYGWDKTIPATVPAVNTSYTAQWRADPDGTVYTVVYWAENAEDDGYSYWDSKQMGANADGTPNGTVLVNDHVSGTDATLRTDAVLSQLTEYQYFTYNAVKTAYEESQRTDIAADGKVVVKGDGSTVVNVYFSRNVYTLTLTDSSVSSCQIEEHTHTDECYEYACGGTQHTKECYVCGKNEHAHTENCCSLYHTHNDSCAGSCNHPHGITCYTNSTTVQTASNQTGFTNVKNSAGSTPAEGKIYRYRENSSTYHNYIYINGGWYYLGTSGRNDTTVAGLTWSGTGPNKNGNVVASNTVNTPGTCDHVHENGCYNCGKVPHTHAANETCNTFDCPNNGEAHKHEASCFVCNKTEVAHTNACCGISEHDHSSCTSSKCNHVHGITCYTNSTTVQTASNQTGFTNVKNSAGSTPAEGKIYRYRENSSTYHNYIYINGGWYYLGTSGRNDTTVAGLTWSGTGPNTNGNVVASNTVNTPKTCKHEHSDSCYSCGFIAHIHGNGKCNTANCSDASHHVHSGECYICGESHVHTSACPSVLACGKVAHSHATGDTYSRKIVKIIQAKYGAYIGDEWTFTTKDGYSYPENAGAASWTPESNTVGLSERLAMIDIMPGASFELYDDPRNNDPKYYNYYVECLEGETADAEYEGVKYRHYLENGTLTVDFNIYTEAEDFFPIEGFTKYRAVRNGTTISNNTSLSAGQTVNFYYKRERVSLKFYNVNVTVKTVDGLVYEYPLKNVIVEGNAASAYVPPYPTTYEPDAYEFGGWYTTPECFPGTEVDWIKGKMPSTTQEVYAKWTPKIHHITVYLTEGDTTTIHEYLIPHGELVPEDERPANPTNGDLEFIGWFYRDENGIEQAFDFNNMPVKDGMRLYAKWSSNVLKTYTIRYWLQGTETPVAAPTTGSALAGTTKTFEAKGGDQLYAEYREGYFPQIQSHSITMDINQEGDIVYTFWYVWKKAVTYTVHYYEKDLDGNPVYVTDGAGNQVNKSVYTSETKTTKYAEVVENYVRVTSYKPDAVQKKLVLSGDVSADNTIIFWYTPNTTHGFVIYNHYLEDLPKPGSTETTWTAGLSYMNEHLIVGNNELPFTIEPMPFEGFTYKPDAEGTVTSGILSQVGQEVDLKLYYTRNKYPYQIQYLEYGTNQVLQAPTVFNGENCAYFGDSVTTNKIPDLEAQGYTYHSVVGCTIRVEENINNPSRNTITVYYVPLYGNLQISKNVSVQGTAPQPDKDLLFEFVVSVPDGVTGTYSATIGGQSTNVTVENGSIKVSIKDGQTATIFGLPVGFPNPYTYRVSETPAPGFQPVFSPGQTVTLTNKVTSSVQCTNLYPVGKLVLTKTVTKEYPPDTWNRGTDQFRFVVTSPSLVNGKTYTVSGPSGQKQYKVSDHTIILDPISASQVNEPVSITVLDIPIGEYTVTEIMNEDTKAYYTTTANGANGYSANVTLTVDSLTGTVNFVNAFKRTKGNLYLEKVLVEAPGFNSNELPTDTEFSFTIQLADDVPNSMDVQVSYSNGTVHQVTTINGSLTVNLKAGENVTITGLPVGEYRITEATIPSYANKFALKVNDAWVEQPVTSAGGSMYLDVTVQTNKTTEVLCTNTYPVDRAELVIQKLVTREYDKDTLPDDSFVFTVKLAETDLHQYSYTVYNQNSSVYAEHTVTVDGENAFEITLKAGQYAVVPNMPVCGYTITESEESQNYNVSYQVYQTETGETASNTVDTSGAVSASGNASSLGRTFAAGKTDIVVFTNQYKKHVTNLTIDRNNAADSEQVFVYDVVNKNGDLMITVTVVGNGETTIYDLPYDDYTVTQRNDWSWRYKDAASKVTLSAGNNQEGNAAKVTFNGSAITKWLDGLSQWIRNICAGG